MADPITPRRVDADVPNVPEVGSTPDPDLDVFVPSSQGGEEGERREEPPQKAPEQEDEDEGLDIPTISVPGIHEQSVSEQMHEAFGTPLPEKREPPLRVRNGIEAIRMFSPNLAMTIAVLVLLTGIGGYFALGRIVRPTEAGADAARVPAPTAVSAPVLPSAATPSPRSASIPVGFAFAFSGLVRTPQGCIPPVIEYKLASSYTEITTTSGVRTETVIDLTGRTVAGEIVFGAFDPDAQATSAPARRQPFSVVLRAPQTMLPPITLEPRSYAQILVHTIDGQPAHAVGVGTARVPAC